MRRGIFDTFGTMWIAVMIVMIAAATLIVAPLQPAPAAGACTADNPLHVRASDERGKCSATPAGADGIGAAPSAATPAMRITWKGAAEGEARLGGGAVLRWKRSDAAVAPTGDRRPCIWHGPFGGSAHYAKNQAGVDPRWIAKPEVLLDDWTGRCARVESLAGFDTLWVLNLPQGCISGQEMNTQMWDAAPPRVQAAIRTGRWRFDGVYGGWWLPGHLDPFRLTGVPAMPAEKCWLYREPVLRQQLAPWREFAGVTVYLADWSVDDPVGVAMVREAWPNVRVWSEALPVIRGAPDPGSVKGYVYALDPNRLREGTWVISRTEARAIDPRGAWVIPADVVAHVKVDGPCTVAEAKDWKRRGFILDVEPWWIPAKGAVVTDAELAAILRLNLDAPPVTDGGPTP